MEGIPDEYNKTVVFLCIDEIDDDGVVRPQPRATGFFVRVPPEGDTFGGLDYVVTGAHCIQEARFEHQGGSGVYVRFNLVNGTSIEIETNPDHWYEHDSADVAVWPILNDALIQPRCLCLAGPGSGPRLIRPDPGGRIPLPVAKRRCRQRVA